MTSDANPAAQARKQGLLTGLIVGVIVGGVLGAFLGATLPELSRHAPAPSPTKGTAGKGGAPGLPAASVEITTTGATPAKTVHIKNTGAEKLTNASLTVRRPRDESSKQMALGEMAPGATRDLGPQDWDWKITPGDVFEVTADGRSAAAYTER